MLTVSLPIWNSRRRSISTLLTLVSPRKSVTRTLVSSPAGRPMLTPPEKATWGVPKINAFKITDMLPNSVRSLPKVDCGVSTIRSEGMPGSRTPF